MISKILTLNPITQAFIAGLFTYSITILGASVVLLFKKVNKSFMDISLSLSSGIPKDIKYSFAYSLKNL